MMAVVAGEIHSLDRTLTEEELRRAKQQLKAAILISREKSSSRCEQLANQLLVFGSPIPATEIAARIDSVQKADILRASRRIFTSAPSLAVLGPGAEKLRMAGMT
jgi:predicted Zn-dependent peptidase